MSQIKNCAIAALVLGSSLFTISLQLIAQSSPSKLPANFKNEPANIQAIDKQIADLEVEKEALQARKYEVDEAAMDHEFQGNWMNYQDEIKREGSYESRIAKIQAEIDQLKAERAKLTK
jgi:hypothetical protein